jgi:hypothetical protein
VGTAIVGIECRTRASIRETLSDPELKRTKEELEAAMANASEAHQGS